MIDIQEISIVYSVSTKSKRMDKIVIIPGHQNSCDLKKIKSKIKTIYIDYTRYEKKATSADMEYCPLTFFTIAELCTISMFQIVPRVPETSVGVRLVWRNV